MLNPQNSPTHSDIVRAINEILALLQKTDLNIKEDVLDFIKWFLIKKNRFLLYVGAGVSKDIRVHYRNGKSEPAITQNWRELLEAVYHKLEPRQRSAFLRSASARVGKLKCLKNKIPDELPEDKWEAVLQKFHDKILTELLNKLGPFRFAWCLRWFAQEDNEIESTEKRDRILAEIVNLSLAETKNRDSRTYDTVKEYKSELLDELMELPFREIITTNYDHYLEEFLKKHEKQRSYVPVYNAKTLIKSFQTNHTRLFYLHGKAGKSETLIFDKHDYAQLFTKNSQILDHLVRLFLKYGVLYVGFGLDDQTFDYMESRMRILSTINKSADLSESVQMPLSYSFMRKAEISVNEIIALRKLFNIRVIRFERFEDVPKILSNINKIVQYISERDIKEWHEGKDEQRKTVKIIYKAAIEEFGKGHLEASLTNFRKALAHTLFWTIEEAGADAGKEYWDDVQAICNIRRRLTLTRSKLRLSPDWKAEEENRHIDINFATTKEIIAEYKEAYKEFLSATWGSRAKVTNNEIIAEEVALKMLKARIDYQKGEYLAASAEFEKFIIKDGEQPRPEYTDVLSLVRRVIRRGYQQKLERYEIRLLETYYFAQCQSDRAIRIFSTQSTQIVTQEMVKSLEKIHQHQLTYLQTDDSTQALLLKEFGNIVVIAHWGLAIGKLRNFSSFVGKGQNSKDRTLLEELEKINKQLEGGWKYAKEYSCMPSPRWETVKHRSRCRTLALIWFNDTSQANKLIDAYKSIQKALELTYGKPGMIGQHIRNLLEAVRLNVITNFAAKKPAKLPVEANSPMCFAASYHYLSLAFGFIDDFLEHEEKENRPDIWWILIQAYETASFWTLVFKDFLGAIHHASGNRLLNNFLVNSDQKSMVESEYKAFDAAILNGENKVEGRITSFQRVFELVKAAQ